MTGAGESMLTEWWFGLPATNGVRIAELDDGSWMAWGHVTPGDFLAAHAEVAAQMHEPAGSLVDGTVKQVWAVLEPTYPGAPDDEWSFRTDVTWATPGAAKVTVAREDIPEPERPRRSLGVVR